MQFALQRLVDGDRFNIIQFNNRHSSLFAAPAPVNERTLAQAQRYVASLVADGGTEMRGAIEQALSASYCSKYRSAWLFHAVSQHSINQLKSTPSVVLQWHVSYEAIRETYR